MFHLVYASRLAIEPIVPGFVGGFPSVEEANALVQEAYLATRRRFIKSIRIVDEVPRLDG